MINIIKALNYKMIRSIDTFVSVGVGILIALMPILMMGGESLRDINGGMYSQSYLQVMMLIPYLMACILGATAVGMDMGDKTINYEILSGHSRAEVFMARVIVAIGWSVGTTIVVSALPIAIFTIANGWGPNVVFVDVLMQYIINIVAGVRMTGFVILMTTIVRHYIAGLFISYGIINTSLIPVMVLDELLKKEIPHVLAMSDVYYLSGISNMMSVVENGEKIEKYDLSVDTGFFLVSILVALAMSAVYVIVAYFIHKNRDMK